MKTILLHIRFAADLVVICAILPVYLLILGVLMALDKQQPDD